MAKRISRLQDIDREKRERNINRAPEPEEFKVWKEYIREIGEHRIKYNKFWKWEGEDSVETKPAPEIVNTFRKILNSFPEEDLEGWNVEFGDEGWGIFIFPVSHGPLIGKSGKYNTDVCFEITQDEIKKHQYKREINGPGAESLESTVKFSIQNILQCIRDINTAYIVPPADRKGEN